MLLEKKKSSALGREYCCCWTVLGFGRGPHGHPHRRRGLIAHGNHGIDVAPIVSIIDVVEVGEVAVVRGGALEEGSSSVT